MATAAASARAGQLLAMLGLRSDVNTAEAFDSKENCHGEGCGFVAGDRKLPVTFYNYRCHTGNRTPDYCSSCPNECRRYFTGNRHSNSI